MTNSFTKKERLCSKKLIEDLIHTKLSVTSYPYRILYKTSTVTNEYPARIAISVAKKRFKKAVDRNRIKRITREAYRLNKQEYLYSKLPSRVCIDMICIYISDSICDYKKADKAIQKALKKISFQITSEL